MRVLVALEVDAERRRWRGRRLSRGGRRRIGRLLAVADEVNHLGRRDGIPRRLLTHVYPSQELPGPADRAHLQVSTDPRGPALTFSAGPVGIYNRGQSGQVLPWGVAAYDEVG